MRGARGWALGALLLIGLLAVVFTGQQNPDSPEHSSNSDAANGTSALRLFAAALGHPTDQVAGSFQPPSPDGMMFVFTPTSAYTYDEAATTLFWVRQGGVLVYASESGDPELDSALGVKRLQGFATATTVQAAGPVAEGVTQVKGGDLAVPFNTSPAQVPILRAGPYVVAYLERIESGSVVVLADPLELANGYLDKADNGRLAADLLGLVDGAAPVAFDEFHHGLTATDLTPHAWILTPWGAAMLWLIVAVFFGLLLRGRRFGPLIPRRVEASRAEAEWAVAVGELLRRAGARAVTLGVLAAASERAVAAHTGLAVQPRERFWQALWQRAPEVAQELDSAERALYGSSASEKDLLLAAQRLHRIAYPVSELRRRRTPQ
jgi:uncharacterized protein DUF4350